MLRLSLSASITILVSAVAIVYAGAGRAMAQDAGTPTPSPSATSVPTATPTASPADLALANRFAHDGESKAAAGAYLAVIDRGRAPERLAARLNLAKLYLSDGSNVLAAKQLDAYLLEAPIDANVRDAQFMLAQALARSGDDAGALALYRAYIQAGGPASIYSLIGEVETMASTGQIVEASTRADALLTEDLPESVRTTFILQMAQSFESTSTPDAVIWYGRLRDVSSAPGDKALGTWRAAELSGNVDSQYEAWVQVLTNYPESSTAQEIVNTPPPVSLPAPLIDPYHRGLVYYYGGANDQARASFEQETASAGPNSANATFYLGAIDERQGLTDDAIAHYTNVVLLDPASERADDALWWQARLLEESGRKDQARAAYEDLANNHGRSGFATDARFRIGVMAYDAGAAGDAASAFASMTSSGDDSDKQRARLWQGKALSASGDADGSRAVLESLHNDAPDSYYGLRAAVLLGEAHGDLTDGDTGPGAGEPDWSTIESWLKDSVGTEPLLAQQVLFSDPHFATGSTLVSMGMTKNARAEFDLLLQRVSGDPGLLLELSRASRSAGLLDVSSRAATRLLGLVPKSAMEQAPPDVWRLAYPAPFSGALSNAANTEDVSNVLLLAMVRQESFFDPLAGSSAGAIGLTQVVPPTGTAIAADLKLSGFQFDDLFQPSLSLRFGAHYLREQLDLFDHDPYAALAAYNAGPGSALRWKTTAGDDVDRFVAEIDFSQTKAYIELVMENLARYRQLYQDLPEPSLPRG